MSDQGILGSIGLSRDDLLGGMPARRASTILFAIENLTLQLVARSRRALSRYQPAESARDKERQFIDAISGGREERARPQIQDIERYASEWTPMVPVVPDIQAAILHQLSTRYTLYARRVPRIRAALATDSDAVAQAFKKQRGGDISTAFVDDIDLRERLRWWRARVSERLETMPPFWMAFSLTLTETVGGGMLAIPIALAWVGVPVGLVLLGIFGLISILTVAALVEGITRDGTMRYGNGYFGQIVENRLGRPGGVAMGIALFALNAISLLVAMTGFGIVLAEQTGVSAVIWVALLFVGDPVRPAPREPRRDDRRSAVDRDRDPRAGRRDDRAGPAARRPRAPGRKQRWRGNAGRDFDHRPGIRRAPFRVLRPHLGRQRGTDRAASRSVGSDAAVGQRGRHGRCGGDLRAVRDCRQRLRAGG